MPKFEEIIDLFKDVPKTNILYILDMFGPLNLQKMHVLLKKHKSTILVNIREMIEDDQIEIDPDATAKKLGKYYTLTSRIRSLLEEDTTVTVGKKDPAEHIALSPEEKNRRYANMVRAIGFQANLIANLTAQYLEENHHQIKDKVKNKEEVLGFLGGNCELGVNTLEEFEEIREIYEDFRQKLRKYDVSNRKNPKNTILMFMIGGTKEKIGPK